MIKLKFLVLLGGLAMSVSALSAQPATPKEIQASMEQMAAAQSKMMQAMMLEKQSKLGFEETVATLQKNAQARGWKIAGVFDAQEAMTKAGHKDAKPMKVIGMCPQPLVETLLKAQQAANMPPGGINCRYSLYEGLDGKVYVMRFNTSLIGQMSKGDVAAAFNNISKEEEAIMAGVLR
jgi:uncharacterized protein (DUF302 family)